MDSSRDEESTWNLKWYHRVQVFGLLEEVYIMDLWQNFEGGMDIWIKCLWIKRTVEKGWKEV